MYIYMYIIYDKYIHVYIYMCVCVYDIYIKFFKVHITQRQILYITVPP